VTLLYGLWLITPTGI